MMVRFSIARFICFLTLLLTACAPAGSTPTAIGTTEPSLTPVTNTEPAGTPDSQIPLEAATLLSVDFENGYPLEIFDWSQRWRIETEGDGNAIFCNEISEEWSDIQFGLDAWKNYAISLRMKFLSANEGQAAETYIRINQHAEGYRASVSTDGWADIGFYPPPSSLGGSPVSLDQSGWFWIQLQFVNDNLQYFVDGEMLIEISDDKRASGRAGVGVEPDTEVCVDDIVVWGLDENGYPIESPADLVIEPFDGTVYSLGEKVDNRPTIPVFYPWSGSGEGVNCGQQFWFDCDTGDTPYSLVWISSGTATDIESTQPEVPPTQTIHMQSDDNTITLISEEWHYWNLGWRTLSPDSKFYLDEVYGFHENSEYGATKVINFEHPEWPAFMAEKALNFMDAGFDGIMLDWWHNGAGNGRSEADVEAARLAIIKAMREEVGNDFILMGNVNWSVDDPTSQYLSGVFLELWKPDPSAGYGLTYDDEDGSVWSPSIERMEDLLKYWDTNLQWPKIIAFEPWKITTGNTITDRNSEENYAYAKLFTAMAVVIPENGYILYADNNDDWDGGDHQHAYYDFFHTDFGKPTSAMVEIMEGVAYKRFEKGIVMYNRTSNEVGVTLPGGTLIKIGPIEGLFLEGTQ